MIFEADAYHCYPLYANAGHFGCENDDPDRNFCLILSINVHLFTTPLHHPTERSESHLNTTINTVREVVKMVLAKSKNAVGLGNSLMNDRFGKGKGNDRKKVTSAGIQRINHATGETVCSSRS